MSEDKPYEQFYRFETDEGTQIEITRRVYFDKGDNPGSEIGEAYGGAIGIEDPSVADKLGKGFARLMDQQRPPKKRAAYEIKIRKSGHEQQLVMDADASEAVINAIRTLSMGDALGGVG